MVERLIGSAKVLTPSTERKKVRINQKVFGLDLADGPGQWWQ
jgi:hypothetical protein